MAINVFGRDLNSRFYNRDIQPVTKHELHLETDALTQIVQANWIRALSERLNVFSMLLCTGQFSATITESGYGTKGAFYVYDEATFHLVDGVIRTVYGHISGCRLISCVRFRIEILYTTKLMAVYFPGTGEHLAFEELDTEPPPEVRVVQRVPMQAPLYG
ncbi:MAG: hypothetical protein Q7R93_01930 [bacterium]|nr:hypothetical protein [bacterium]